MPSHQRPLFQTSTPSFLARGFTVILLIAGLDWPPYARSSRRTPLRCWIGQGAVPMNIWSTRRFALDVSRKSRYNSCTSIPFVLRHHLPCIAPSPVCTFKHLICFLRPFRVLDTLMHAPICGPYNSYRSCKTDYTAYGTTC